MIYTLFCLVSFVQYIIACRCSGVFQSVFFLQFLLITKQISIIQISHNICSEMDAHLYSECFPIINDAIMNMCIHMCISEVMCCKYHFPISALILIFYQCLQICIKSLTNIISLPLFLLLSSLCPTISPPEISVYLLVLGEKEINFLHLYKMTQNHLLKFFFSLLHCSNNNFIIN